MKVQIVYLNPEDDLYSTRDMLGWVKAPRALLVWPDRGRVLTRRMDLALLQRFASQRQMQIGLVTFDPDVRGEAQELGIPLFESLEDLPEERWQDWQAPSSRLRELRESLRASHEQRRHGKPISEKAVSFVERNKTSLLLFLLLFLIAFSAIFAPSAKIVLAPVRSLDQIRLGLAFMPYEEGSVGAEGEWIEKISLEWEESATRPTSGWRLLPVSASKGRAVFVSHSAEPLEIPKGTILSTQEGQLFQTSQKGSLPAEVGAFVSIPIEAIHAGKAGNVSPGVITRIQGPLGLLIFVSNPEGTSGGEDALFRSVSQFDQGRLERELLKELLAQAERYLSEGLDEQHVFVEGSLKVSDVLERSFDCSPGEIANQMTLWMKVELDGITLRKDVLWEMATETFADHLPRGRAVIPESYFVHQARLARLEGSGDLEIAIFIEGAIYSQLDLDRVRRQISGRSPIKAQEWLSNALDLEQPAIVSLQPSWFPILPWIGDRIEILWAWENR